MTQTQQQTFHARDFAGVTGWNRAQDLTPFIIPNLDRDSDRRIVITAELARTHRNPIVRDMYSHAQKYWRIVDLLARAAARGHRREGIELERRLSFPERPELRFGHTRFGHAGAGVGAGSLGAELRDHLLVYEGFRGALIVHPDALQLMPNFAGDRVTDALGSILFRDLVRFTQECAKSFDPRCIRVCTFENIFNEQTGRIDPQFIASLPVDDHAHPIVLLPKEIVRGSCALEASDYLKRVRVAGQWEQRKLNKSELLTELGLDERALVNFVAAQLTNVQMHKSFQTGAVRRRRQQK